MSVADKMSQAYVQGADDQKRQLAKEINAQENELKALRALADEHLRIISEMTKQIRKLHEEKENR